ncbi:general secretion pathway protein GspK [Pseudomonas putida]|uniref:General secretion pathway protein GspK n=1 Tax=Pseudomonas putida TaxID=303 RepID=A0A6I6Y758_PSEPU|nr:type II secretion system protein GspK [Pseudomonas putida]QHG67470.1 general secretion pathway protein GspK [Pseudomonas putida]
MALSTLLIAGMLRSHQGMLGSMRQQIDASRLLQLAHAGEHHALKQLKQQAATLLQVTHRGQPWAQTRLLDLEQGQVRLRLEDLSGRFNIAALTARKTLDPVLLERWQRLCHALQIEAPMLEPLAGQRLLDPSQLRALPGVDAQVMARLQPWVVALPTHAGLNVNTALAQVLEGLEGVDATIARSVTGKQPEQGYASVQQFLAQPQLVGLGIDSHGLSVTSRWYRLEVRAEVEGNLGYLYSDLEIDPNTHQVRVLRRFFSAQPEHMHDE